MFAMNCYFLIFLIFLLSTLSKGKYNCIGDLAAIKELDYDLEDRHNFFKLISESGVDLIVGSPFVKPFFGKGDTYICSELAEEKKNEHKEATETFVEIRNINRSKSDVVINSVNEYFIYDSMQVWECENSKKESFLRVYNTLISIKEIGGVHYFDTVKVSSVNYNGDEAIVKIAELKYVKKIDGKYVTVKYEGLLDSSPPETTYANKIEKLYPSSNLPNSEMAETERQLKQKWMLPDSFKAIQISSSGKKLFIDAPVRLVNFTGNASCLKLQGVNNPFPHHFKPQIYEYDEFKNRVKIGEKDFSKYFAILNRVVWKCSAGIEGFYRIQNEVVTRTEVEELIFSDQIQLDYVHSIRLTQGTGIRFKETRQFDILSGRPVHFGGELTYKFDPEFSSTFDHIPNKMDIFYRLSSEAVYRTFISSKGYDLRIGSRSEESIPTEITSVDCTGLESMDSLYSDVKLNTKIKVKTNKNEMIHAMERARNNRDYIFKNSKKEVWKCQKKNIKFLRVVNKLKIMAPVRYLETFDGVEIFYVDLPEIKEKSVNILEIKYLDFDNPNKVVSYGGKLKFGKDTRQRVTETYAKVITAVQKTTEETVPIIGRNYDSLSLLMRDHDPIIFAEKPPSETFVYPHSGIDNISSMEFSASISNSLTIENEVIECEFMPSSKKLPPVDIKLINKKTGEVTDKIKLGMDDPVEYSKYFETKVSEVWKCKLPNQVEPILRIVNRQELKENPNTLMYNPNVDTVCVELENDKYVIKMEDIRYLDQTNQQLIYLNASIALAERKEPGYWMSGTKRLTQRINPKDPTRVTHTFHDGLKIAEKTWQQPKSQVSGVRHELGKISYSGKIQTMTFRKGPRMFQIGSLWEKELPEMNTPMHCEIAPSNIFGNRVYIPRVMEYVEGKMHLLDEETLMDAFNIPFRKVWLCSNGEDKIIRLFTVLCAKEPFLAVRYLDGVEVKTFPISQNSESAEVTETIHFDVSTYNTLKYEGTPYTTSKERESGAPFCPPIVKGPPIPKTFMVPVKTLITRIGNSFKSNKK